MPDELTSLKQELRQHIDYCNQRFTRGEEQFDELIQCNKETLAAVENLTSETSDMVQLYKDMKGAVRIGAAAQKFWVWVLKWSSLAVIITVIYNRYKGNGS